MKRFGGKLKTNLSFLEFNKKRFVFLHLRVNPLNTESEGLCGRYLVQRNVVDGRPIDLKDPITDMNRVFHIRTNALLVNPGGGKTISGKKKSLISFCLH